MKKNLVLIGMPAVGKSTLGVILAKLLGLSFIDSDLVIQEKEGRLLKDIIHDKGVDGFIEIENTINASLSPSGAIISTGGSAVYGTDAMKHFKEIGTVLYLKVSYDVLSKRLKDVKNRGVVLRENQTIQDIYEERSVLYERYADLIVDVSECSIEESVEKIMKLL